VGLTIQLTERYFQTKACEGADTGHRSIQAISGAAATVGEVPDAWIQDSTLCNSTTHILSVFTGS